MSAARALARQTARDARTRTISFALLFLLGSGVQGAAYRDAYPTLAGPPAARAQLRRRTGRCACSTACPTICSPSAATCRGGWAPSRSSPGCGACSPPCARCAPRRTPAAGSSSSSGPVSRAHGLRRGARGDRDRARRSCGWRCWSGSCSVAPGPGPSVFLSIALVSPLPVFVGVGAVASQVAPTRRMATGDRAARCSPSRCSLRMVADTSVGRLAALGRRRWAGPRSCARSPARGPRCCSCRRWRTRPLLVAARGSTAGATSARACSPPTTARRRACACSPRPRRSRCARSAAACSPG